MSDDFRRRLQGPTSPVPTLDGDFFAQPIYGEPVLSSPKLPTQHSLLRDIAMTALFVAPAIAVSVYGPYQRFANRNTASSYVQGIPSDPSCEEIRSVVDSERTPAQDTYLKDKCN